MKKQIYFWILSFMALNMFSQTSFNKIYRVHNSIVEPTCILGGIIATDTAFFMNGTTRLDTSNFHYAGLYIEVDTFGNILQTKTYGRPQKNTFMEYNNMQLDDMGYLLNTGEDNYSYDEPSVFFQKTGQNGSIVFTEYYYSPDTTTCLGSLRDFTKIDENHYVLFCGEYGNGIGNKSSIMIITNSLGTELLRYTYPILSYQNIRTSEIEYLPQDSSFIFGTIVQNGSEYDNNLQVRTIITKVNSKGEKLWEYKTPIGRNIYCPRIHGAKNGDFILFATENIATYIGNGQVDYKQVAYVARMDTSQNIIWEKRFGNPGYSYFGDMVEKNGFYYLLGTTTTQDSSLSKGWLFKMSENGDSIWSQYYMYADFYGSYSSHLPAQLQSYKDGFVFCGTIYNDLPMSNPNRGYWGWLVRTDSMGNISQMLNTSNTEPIKYEQLDMCIFPNPTVGILNLALKEALKEDATIIIYTAEGKKVSDIVFLKGEKHKQINTYYLPQGFYNCVLQVDGNQVYSKSFLKIN